MLDILPILLMGLGLGLVHAFDADHVMAISTMSSEKPGLKNTLFYSLHWAVGHGLVLLLVAYLLLALGLSLPEPLVSVAEKAVGVVLIVLGAVLLWRFRQQKIQLRTHSHGDVVHSHWHEQNHIANAALNQRRAHKPVMVGLLHGLAGSAPVLALLPAVAQGQWQMGLIYVVIFSLGVTLSMLVFGLGFGYFQRVLKQRFPSLMLWSQRLVACMSIALGLFWLQQAM